MKLLLGIVLSLSLVTPVFAQEPVVNPTDPKVEALIKELNTLKEQVGNLIKTGAQKDAEIASLKASLNNSPENIDKLVKSRAQELKKLKASPAVRACRDVKGKAIISSDSKGALVYSGCLL